MLLIQNIADWMLSSCSVGIFFTGNLLQGRNPVKNSSVEKREGPKSIHIIPEQLHFYLFRNSGTLRRSWKRKLVCSPGFAQLCAHESLP
ncbi:hypothetical protein Y032_0014g2369 [Ancylostoma ceylanicum]|uniref:Uncharacterized protein n=2 Tax=Ancylostoma ceylanicum TaxID=53326 RepID=A0A016V9S3_9BILA|nr:hypothetical protein Y032_0014g2369 [Ancylostoma ceylanicum]